MNWTATQLQPGRQALALHMLAPENFTVYARKLRVRRPISGRREDGEIRSFPTRSSCAARWCPGVVRLIMDGVQPAKVSDLLSRKSAATNARADRVPRRLLNGRVRLLFQGLSQKARNHHARVADQTIQTQAAAVRRTAHHPVLGKRLIQLLQDREKVMRQLPLEFGEVA